MKVLVDAPKSVDETVDAKEERELKIEDALRKYGPYIVQ